MHYLVKRLTLRLIKLDKNYRNYYLNSITIVLYFLLYMSSYQINFQFKNFQKLMDLNCLPQNLTTNLDYQKSANICFFFCKHYYFFLGKRWSNSCDCSNVIHQKFWKFLNLNFIWKNVYTRNITQLLDSLNNNYGNFCQIWSNEVLIFSQDNAV